MPHFSFLLMCYRSGQLSERQWQEHLECEPGLRTWLNREVQGEAARAKALTGDRLNLTEYLDAVTLGGMRHQDFEQCGFGWTKHRIRREMKERLQRFEVLRIALPRRPLELRA